MTSKQVDYCIELAHTLNFSRAAENLFVSQPTFSYQIRLLEEEVGFQIFERSGRGASLTPAGADFVFTLANLREELKRAGAELLRAVSGQHLHLPHGAAGGVFPPGGNAALCRGI